MRIAAYLVLDTAGLHLVGEDLGAGLLGLGLVDVLHQDTLVLEDVTLGLLVELVVAAGCRVSEGGSESRSGDAQMLVDLASLPVLPQQAAKHALPPHPLNLRRHTGLGRTLALTRAGVATLALCGKKFLCACARVNGGGLDDDAAILDELLHVGAGVGVPNLSLLSGVQPDFTLADACDRCGEPLL